MKKAIRKVLALVCCISLILAMVSYRPPEADAVVLEAASVVAAVAVILTACGVSYWANSQTDAINYIGGKIDAYLQTLEEPPATYEDWLDLHDGGALFEVLNGGIMRFGSTVANKILDFVSWFIAEENIESGGQLVGVFGENLPLVECAVGSTDMDATQFSQSCTRVLKTNSYYLGALSTDGTYPLYLFVITPRNNVYRLYAVVGEIGVTGSVYSGFFSVNSSNVASFLSSSKGAVDTRDTNTNLFYENLGEYSYNSNNGEVYIGVETSERQGLDDVYAIVTGDKSFHDKAVITPSNDVTIPSVGDAEAIDILPSVTLEAGDTVENASDVILEGITSESGLSATIEGDVIGVPSDWTWLQDLLTGFIDSVLSIPGTIISGITSALERLFIPSEAFIDSYVASLYGDFDNHFSILSYPFSVLGEFITRLTQSSHQEPIFDWGDVKEPFSGRIIIPSGSYNLNDSLQNSTFSYMHSLYFIVVEGWISFWFLSFLYNWFCDVFKMREADMDNPNLDEDFV